MSDIHNVNKHENNTMFFFMLLAWNTKKNKLNPYAQLL